MTFGEGLLLRLSFDVYSVEHFLLSYRILFSSQISFSKKLIVLVKAKHWSTTWQFLTNIQSWGILLIRFKPFITSMWFLDPQSFEIDQTKSLNQTLPTVFTSIISAQTSLFCIHFWYLLLYYVMSLSRQIKASFRRFLFLRLSIFLSKEPQISYKIYVCRWHNEKWCRNFH